MRFEPDDAAPTPPPGFPQPEPGALPPPPAAAPPQQFGVDPSAPQQPQEQFGGAPAPQQPQQPQQQFGGPPAPSGDPQVAPFEARVAPAPPWEQQAAAPADAGVAPAPPWAQQASAPVEAPSGHYGAAPPEERQFGTNYVDPDAPAAAPAPAPGPPGFAAGAAAPYAAQGGVAPAPAVGTQFGAPAPAGGNGEVVWGPSRPKGESRNARTSMIVGLLAVLAFAINYLVGNLIVALLVILASIQAIVQGHLGIRDVRRGMTGKAKAVTGLVTGYLMIAVTAAILALAALFVASLSGALNDLPAGPASGDAPASAADIPAVSPYALSPGACMIDPWDTAANGGRFGQSFQVVPCSELHAAEVVFVDINPGYGHPETDSAADAKCLAGFESYIGADYFDSAYFYFAYYPSIDEWNSGTATVVCAAYFGDYLTGSQQGSGR